MRQYLILTLSILFVANYVFAEVRTTVKIGLDMLGDHHFSAIGISDSLDVENGFSISVEPAFDINEYFDIGGGMIFQFPRSLEIYQEEFNFMPIYGLVKLRPNSDKVSPYIIGQLGYNFFFGDDAYKGTGTLSGGIYYGIGGGLFFTENLQAELLYSVNNGSLDILGVDVDIKYSHLGLSLGIIF